MADDDRSGVARHAGGPRDGRALRGLAAMSVVSIAVAVAVYAIVSVTTAHLVLTPAPPPAVPVGSAAPAQHAQVSEEPADSGGLLPPAPQPATAPTASRPVAGAGAPGTAQPAGPVPPTVTLSRHDVAPVVDLTKAGSVDWVHFGHGSAGPPGVDRKRTGTPAIADQGSPAPRGWYDTNPQRFSWTDGQPTARAAGTPTGVYVCGAGGGFALAVDAGPVPRTLRLYAGLWRARGQLTATLAGAQPVTAYLENRATNGTAEFTVTFRAPAGTRLLLRWVAVASFDPRCGNVDLQAAALS